MISWGKNLEKLIGFCEDFKIRETRSFKNFFLSTIFWVVELKYPHKTNDPVGAMNYTVAMYMVCNNRKVETSVSQLKISRKKRNVSALN